MLTRSRRYRVGLVAVLAALATLLAAQLGAVARYRLDYPVVDDWRYYYVRSKGMPEVLSLEWLFTPAQDTLHVTGKLIDWLVFRLLAHDYNLLATISFGTFFGGWLAASVALCIRAAGERPAVLFAALSVFVLTLAGAPYWVTLSPYHYLEPSIAYHQMLPMVALAILAVSCVSARSLAGRPLSLVSAAAVTAVFALAYSSGAFILFLFGGGMLVLWVLGRRVDGELRREIPGIALAICATAGACLAMHVLMSTINPVTEARMFELTPPWRTEFWFFVFALFDRAVLSTALDGVSDLRGIGVLAIVAIPAIGLTVQLARTGIEARRRRVAMVLVAVLASVLGYAALVAYGRAAFGGYYFPEVFETPKRVSLYAHSRFFYWWITAVLPLSLVAWWLFLEPFSSRRTVDVVVAAMALWMLVPKGQLPESYGDYFHHWDYTALYQRDAEEVADLIDRDVKRMRGKVRQSKRYDAWLSIDPERRNPGYREGETHSETSKVRMRTYRNALKLQATFVERWGLVR